MLKSNDEVKPWSQDPVREILVRDELSRLEDWLCSDSFAFSSLTFSFTWSSPSSTFSSLTSACRTTLSLLPGASYSCTGGRGITFLSITGALARVELGLTNTDNDRLRASRNDLESQLLRLHTQHPLTKNPPFLDNDSQLLLRRVATLNSTNGRLVAAAEPMQKEREEERKDLRTAYEVIEAYLKDAWRREKSRKGWRKYGVVTEWKLADEKAMKEKLGRMVVKAAKRINRAKQGHVRRGDWREIEATAREAMRK